jgi:hypothetical protein
MPLESKISHIHDPVLLSLKMEGIRLLFFILTEMCFLFQVLLEVSVVQAYRTHAVSTPVEQNWAVGPWQPLQIPNA